jgi:hypothetical protein
MGKHLLNDLLLSSNKSSQVRVLEAPQASKMHGFAKGIHWILSWEFTQGNQQILK